MPGYMLSTLNTVGNRRRFDASKKADVLAFASFRKNNKWEGGCPFYLEWPYVNIAVMCLEKYADRMLTK
jgi:hypothetical protein